MFKLLLIVSVAVAAASAVGIQGVSMQTVYVQGPMKPLCGQNEIYLPQGIAPYCDSVCSELGKPCTRKYIQAPFGCYCLPDHARDANNACVHMSQCPIKCIPKIRPEPPVIKN